MNKGKDFEKLVANIERALYNLPGVKVFHNIKLNDTRGGKRQIDVLITDERDRFIYKTIIECKNSKTKVNINIVEAFKGLMKEVGAHQGIIVSSNGFQAGALRAVKNTNIHLYQLGEVSELERHLKEYRINIYELKHESKDIVVGFNAPSEINEYVSTKSLLFSPYLDRLVSISDIAKDFLEKNHQNIVDTMLRSVIDPFKIQTIIGSTEISVSFPIPLLFVQNSEHTEVAGFRAVIETTLETGPAKLHRVSNYKNVVIAKTEALVFELNIEGHSYHWLEKYLANKKN